MHVCPTARKSRPSRGNREKQHARCLERLIAQSSVLMTADSCIRVGKYFGTESAMPYLYPASSFPMEEKFKMDECLLRAQSIH